MGKITEISVQKNNKERANLYIDGEFYSGISIETAYNMRLKVGDEIENQTLLKVIEEDDKQRAFIKAVDYISRAIKTKKQVKDYLVKKGFSVEIAYYVIDKLKDYGYIDDKEYAKSYVESTSKTQGKRLVAFKLMQKGVKKEDIELAYLEWDDSVDMENAKLLAEKRLNNKEKTKENLMKTYKYLIGRGFSYEQADYAISSFREGE